MTLRPSQKINSFCIVKNTVPGRVDISLCDLLSFLMAGNCIGRGHFLENTDSTLFML